MSTLKPSVNSHDHQVGDENALVTLVEFGDFECPHCGHAHPLLKQLIHKMGSQLHFVFRHFPLQESHPHAFAAALASEAAARQGKFWQMHDLIFEHQNNLGTALFLQLARRLNLDEHQFQNDLQNEALFSKVEMDFESGVRSGVNGTPSFFLNNHKLSTYDGTYESLLRAVELRGETK